MPLLFLQVREEMRVMKDQHEAQVVSLRSRLEWYAKNQELLTENDDLVKQQVAVIADLRKRLEAAHSEGSSRRVAELTDQVIF
jgi:hypothetical protein